MTDDYRRLPEHISEALSSVPEYRMGVHRITVLLDDGRVFHDVDVAWQEEIVGVEGGSSIRFDPNAIVSVWSRYPAQPRSGGRFVE